MNHYFFKFGKQNRFFKKCLDENISPMPLSIYFGKWKVEDYKKHTKAYLQALTNTLNKTLIETFLKCGDEEYETSIFWIFYKNDVYALKPCDELQNGDYEEFKNSSGSPPKTIPCKIMNNFSKDKLPEAFATLNSNQKYNRKTIVKFDDKIAEICNFLLENIENKNNKMKIKFFDSLEYLSPVQFETLIFLIFHHHDIHASTYRGGTLENFDLKIVLEGDDNNKITGIEQEGVNFIQVKMYDYLASHKKFSYSGNKYLIHLGDTNFEKNILGKDWIFSEIEKLEKVQNWLGKSLSFFKIVKE